MKFKKWYFVIVGTLIPVSLIVIAGIYIYFSLIQGERIEWWFIAILGMMMLMSIGIFRFMLNSIISLTIIDETAKFERLNGKQVMFSLNEITLVKRKTTILFSIQLAVRNFIPIVG